MGIEALRADGGQAPGALHYIIAGGSVQSIGKSVIGGEKISKANKYSLTGKYV